MSSKRIFSILLVVAHLEVFTAPRARCEDVTQTMVIFSVVDTPRSLPAFRMARLCRIPIGGGEVETLANLMGNQPALQPGGKRVAFIGPSKTKDDVYLAQTDGSTVKNISNLDKGCEGLAWSSDGAKLAFAARVGTAKTAIPFRDIYVVDADGTNLRNVTRSEYDESSPQWGPDARWLAFLTLRKEEVGWALALWTNDKNIDIAWSRSDVSAFSASPTEDKIAFIAGKKKKHVYLLDVLTKKVTELGLGDIAPSNVCFSPAGDQLAITGGGIWLVHADGKALRRIAPEGAYPVWSPDGKRLVYQIEEEVYGDSDLPGTRSVTCYQWLWGVETSGANIHRLCNERGAIKMLGWSPDGNVVVFALGFPTVYFEGEYQGFSLRPPQSASESQLITVDVNSGVRKTLASAAAFLSGCVVPAATVHGE